MRFKSIIVAASALAATAAAAQGSAGRSYPVGGFDSVSSAGPHNVVVTLGRAGSVRAEGPADLLDRMEVVVEGSDLKIRPRREFRDRPWRDDRKATFYVTAPAIRAAAIAGSGDMTIDRVESGRFSGAIAGSGDMSVAALRVAEANFSVAGSGGIRAAGTAQRSRISIAGSGDVNLEALESRNATISIMGSGDVRTRATESAAVSVMGSGDVVVTGPARCTVNKRGSGRVRCGA